MAEVDNLSKSEVKVMALSMGSGTGVEVGEGPWGVPQLSEQDSSDRPLCCTN